MCYILYLCDVWNTLITWCDYDWTRKPNTFHSTKAFSSSLFVLFSVIMLPSHQVILSNKTLISVFY